MMAAAVVTFDYLKTLSTLKEVNKRALIKECFVYIKTESTSVP